MPKLANARYELFAQGVAAGNSLTQAYREAGFKGKPTNTWELKKRPEVAQRISELLDEVRGRKTLDLGRAIGELASLAFSDVTQVVNWIGEVTATVAEKDEDGQEVKKVITKAPARMVVTDSARLDSVTRAAIAGIKRNRYGEIEVTMHPKLPALDKLIEHLKELEALKPETPQIAGPAGQVIDFAAINARFAAKPKAEEEAA